MVRGHSHFSIVVVFLHNRPSNHWQCARGIDIETLCLWCVGDCIFSTWEFKLYVGTQYNFVKYEFSFDLRRLCSRNESVLRDITSSPGQFFFAYETDEQKQKRKKGPGIHCKGDLWPFPRIWGIRLHSNINLFVILARIITLKWRSKRTTVCVATCRSGSSARVRAAKSCLCSRGPYCVWWLCADMTIVHLF